MKRKIAKRIALLSLALAVLAIITVGAISLASGNNPGRAILDLFRQNQEKSPTA